VRPAFFAAAVRGLRGAIIMRSSTCAQYGSLKWPLAVALA